VTSVYRFGYTVIRLALLASSRGIRKHSSSGSEEAAPRKADRREVEPFLLYYPSTSLSCPALRRLSHRASPSPFPVLFSFFLCAHVCHRIPIVSSRRTAAAAAVAAGLWSRGESAVSARSCVIGEHGARAQYLRRISLCSPAAGPRWPI